MVKTHLASARECIVRSACAKGGVTCGYHSSCVRVGTAAECFSNVRAACSGHHAAAAHEQALARAALCVVRAR